MKKYKAVIDGGLLLGLLLIAAVSIAPEKLLMPNSLQMLLLGTVLALLSFFLLVVWREKPEDERELENQASASRLAYTVGCVTLIVALLFQSLSHSLDPVIPVTITLMIATKIIVQRYKDNQ